MKSRSSGLPPSTPVLIGVAQFSERLEDADYAALSPADLAARAATGALADAGAPADRIDLLAATRQFYESVPGLPPAFGTSTNMPRSIAARIGADPARAIYEVSGGQSPQTLVAEAAAEIAAGRSTVALVVGSEAISTMAHLGRTGEKPDWSEDPGGQLEDRGFGLKGLITKYAATHGLTDATSQYALFENARRVVRGESRADYNRSMGELFAPMTEVAAQNPYAFAPTRRTPEELVALSEDNRMIADPFPQRLVARDKVNLAAAVVLTSVAVADELGIPETRRVFLHGHANLREQPLLERADLGASPASALAVRTALEVAGIGLDDVAAMDLYSCYPIAVAVVADQLGLRADDPRGLTLTGGLPYFGGPGNAYSLHAIAEAVVASRMTPGSFTLVGANGGTLSKYAAGVYSTTPVAWRPGRDAERQAEIDAWPLVAVDERPNGWATIETWTVRFGRHGKRTGIVIGRLEETGARFLARVVSADDELLDVLLAEDGVGPGGRRVFARATGPGNKVALTPERMEELVPTAPVGFRETYEFVEVRREGRVLEVTINRPEARNALTPDANQELSEVFDAFEADRDLWVAIITGAGEKAFCSGNDLMHTASGGSLWFPLTGFGGLTHRRGLAKPVIAAVNGAAYGGGFEIALACHLVVAEEQAAFALSEVKVGLAAIMGGLVRLPRQVPAKVAHEMVLTGRPMPAAEALRWGVVNRVVPTGGALAAARELAAEIVAVSPTSVRASLRLIEEAASYGDPIDALEAPTEAVDDLLFARDTIEGIAAFALKTEPVWRNQ